MPGTFATCLEHTSSVVLFSPIFLKIAPKVCLLESYGATSWISQVQHHHMQVVMWLLSCAQCLSLLLQVNTHPWGRRRQHPGLGML